MTPFAIAGVQMHIAAQNNIPAMSQRLDMLMQLGQPLKSFRDRNIDFNVYDNSRWQSDYLDSLGPLTKPDRRELPAL